MVKRTALHGCCAGSLWYDFGGAHGFPNQKSQEEFDKITIDKYSGSTVNIAVTNSYQDKTADYLREQGWKSQKVGNLFVWTISYTELSNYRNRRLLKKRTEKLPKKLSLAAIRSFMGTQPLTSPLMAQLATAYGVKVPIKWMGSRDCIGIFNSLKTLIAQKNKKIKDESGFKEA